MRVVFEKGELPKYDEFLRAARKAWVTQVLEHERVQGNLSEAARIAEMDRSNFRRLMRHLGLQWVDD